MVAKYSEPLFKPRYSGQHNSKSNWLTLPKEITVEEFAIKTTSV